VFGKGNYVIFSRCNVDIELLWLFATDTRKKEIIHSPVAIHGKKNIRADLFYPFVG
jgi:hypothetical protein